MTERPILFSGPMVQALLAGTKKQTRRILQPKHLSGTGWQMPNAGADAGALTANLARFCPYGAPGDRLWVRETWGYRGAASSNQEPGIMRVDIAYKADDAKRTIVRPGDDWSGIPKQREMRPGEAREAYDRYLSGYFKAWKPSIHMPRWVSRLTLGVTEVRVQRLQDISEEDAKAEGVESWPGASALAATYGTNHRSSFVHLWDSINGERPGCSWEKTPWVWVISFNTVAPKDRKDAK